MKNWENVTLSQDKGQSANTNSTYVIVSQRVKERKYGKKKKEEDEKENKSGQNCERHKFIDSQKLSNSQTYMNNSPVSLK